MSNDTTGKTLGLIVSPFLKWNPRKNSFFLSSCWIASVLLLSATEGMATNYYVENANQFNSTVDKNGANFSTLRAGNRQQAVPQTGGSLYSVRHKVVPDTVRVLIFLGPAHAKDAKGAKGNWGIKGLRG